MQDAQIMYKSVSRRDSIIEDNLPLVKYFVKKCNGGAMAGYSEDLYSVGCIGLIKAVDTYNPDRGALFSSYASRCIQNEMFSYIDKMTKHPTLSLDAETDANGRLMDMLADARRSVEECIDDQCNRRELYMALRMLPYNERTAVTMYYIEGKKQVQIAKVLNVTQAAVSKLIARALPQMRIYLQSHM